MTDDPTWTIYGLRLTGTTEIRYVGQTKTLERRLYLHRWHATTATRPPGLPVHKWIAAKGADNIEHVILEQLNPAVGKEALDDAERRHIAELRNAGHRLLNLTDGGEGTHGYTGTPEKNQAHAERMRGEGNPRYGIPPSPQTRARISNALTGKPLSDETRRKLSEARAGRSLSEEHRRAIGDANRGRIHDEETRAKMRAAHEARGAEARSQIGYKASAKRAAAPDEVKAARSARRREIAKSRPDLQAKLTEAASRARAEWSPEEKAARRAKTQAAWTPEKRAAMAEKARIRAAERRAAKTTPADTTTPTPKEKP